MKRLMSALVVAAAALLGTATAASAAPLPVLYNNANGWSSPTVKPAWIIIGNGGAPGAHTWHWNTWSSTTATSTGTLWVNSCVPMCSNGKESYHKLYVTLSWVKTHGTVKYFSKMTWYTPDYRLPGYKTSTVTMFYVTLFRAVTPGWQSCYPLTSGGNCYLPGQFCPSKDHWVSGVAGNGTVIRCLNKNGWRWEPA